QGRRVRHPRTRGPLCTADRGLLLQYRGAAAGAALPILRGTRLVGRIEFVMRRSCASVAISVRATLLFVMFASARSSPGQSPQPDVLIFNAHVITMNRQQPTAEAIAIRGSRVVWVGNSADAQKSWSGAVRRVDLHGATVLP